MADKKKILDYLEANVKNYQQGVELIAEFGSPMMAASYRSASPRFMMPQVLALLRRLAGVGTKPTINKSAPKSEPSSHPTGSKLPEPIIKAKSLLHSLYLSMVDYHNRLIALGDENTPSLCKARTELFKLRQPAIDKFVALNDLVEDYHATLQVPPALEELIRPTAEPIATPSANLVSDLSDLNLAKEYKRTKSKINRRINKLRFQSDRPQVTINPMPESPLRTEIELELTQLRSYITAIQDEQRRRGLIK